MKIRFPVLFFLFVGIFVMIVGGYMLLTVNKKHNGVLLNPNGIEIAPVIDTPICIKGNESNLKNAIINQQEGYNVCSGICALTQCIKYLGFKYNLKKVDSLMNYKKGFTKNHQINWKKMEDAFPYLTFYQKRLFSYEDVNNSLKLKQLLIAEIHSPEGIKFVSIVGSTKEDYLVIDPTQNPNTLFKNLNTLGKVYALRIVYKTGYKSLDRTR
jgi:hypothetical protein